MFSRRSFLGVTAATFGSVGAWFATNSIFQRGMLKSKCGGMWGADVTSASGGKFTVPLLKQDIKNTTDELTECEKSFLKDNPGCKCAYSYIIENNDGRFGIIVSDKKCRLV
jgi:hypothetical protein